MRKLPSSDCFCGCLPGVIFVSLLLPPAYVVRWEGTVFTGVCLSTGGVGQVQPGGVGQVQPGGGRGGSGPAGGRGGSGPARGEGWVRSSRGGGVGQVQLEGRSGSGPAGGGGSGPAGGRGGSGPAGGGRGGSGPAGGGVGQVQLGGLGQVQPGGGSAKIAQHRKYLLHGGRYASCVHAGGLSCIQNVDLGATKGEFQQQTLSVI